MLYVFENIDLLDDNFLDSKRSFLSEERLAKIQRLRSVDNKKASAVVYLLLRLALLNVYDLNEVVEFSYKENGKPALKDFPHIFFNLSHSFNTAACVVADVEVGVDVQRISSVKDKVAKRVLTDVEFAAFKSSTNPDEFFNEIWTIKESYLKRSGQGIAADLRMISADAVNDKMIYKRKDYFCCVCGSGLKKINIKHIGREDFEYLGK